MQPSYKGTFEAHITVKAVNAELKRKFCLLCQKLAVKCVFIELPQGVTRSQMMTASYHHGALKDVLQKINQIAEKIVNEVLNKYCLQHNAHLSKNAFKKLIDGKHERFITMRIYGLGYKSAQTRFDNLILYLKSKGFKLSQQQREYTVYDTNLNLDNGWIN